MVQIENEGEGVMVVGLAVIGGTGSSVIGNFLTMALCCVIALCVGPAASAMHRLRGWRWIAANVALTSSAVVALAVIYAPRLAPVMAQVVIDCSVFWFDLLCWLAG